MPPASVTGADNNREETCIRLALNTFNIKWAHVKLESQPHKMEIGALNVHVAGIEQYHNSYSWFVIPAIVRVKVHSTLICL